MESLTLEQLYQRLKQMRKVKENRDKKMRILFGCKDKQIGACPFDKIGIVTRAGNIWETRDEDSTIPVIRVDEQ